MGPLLDALRELGDSASTQEASDRIAQNCEVSDEKREEVTESGTPRFHNQVCWARQYLVWEGLLGSAKRGVWTLTERGKETHLTKEEGYGIFKKWVAIHAEKRKAKKKLESEKISAEDEQEDEQEDELDELDGQLALLSVMQSMTPNGFERFCKYLLRIYGFEKVEVTPVGKDGGIDGVGVLQLNPFV